MSKILLKSLLASPAFLGAALAISSAANAVEAGKTQVTSVDALTDASALVINQDAKEQAVQVDAPMQASAPVVESAAAESAAVASPAEVAPVEAAPVARQVVMPKAPIMVAQAAPQPAVAAPADNTSADLDQINRYSREGRSNAQGQVTSVSQLTDVKPTDWAFQALQSLVERYGCIVGFPDRTYRGNQATTRYEFAAGLNACMDRISELIAAGTADLVKKEDLAVLQKLQEEFAAELATLRGRVDALEARTATLEKQQFSTTTKLAGEVIFAVTDEFYQPINNATVFQDRVRLNFNTSFTGKDLLVTRLAAGNAELFRYRENAAGGANLPYVEATQQFNLGNTGGNSVVVDWLAYYFPLGKGINVYIPVAGGLQYDYAPTASGFQEDYDGGKGALTPLASRNPIYQIGGGSGIGVNFGAGPFKISAGYLADNANVGSSGAANVPIANAGLFDGSYGALGQITFGADSPFTIALTYVNAYRKSIGGAGLGGTGLFGSGGVLPVAGTWWANGAGKNVGANVNAYGASAAWKMGTSFSVNGYFSYISSDYIKDGFGASEIWTYGLGVSFADLLKKGNLLGLFAGVAPYVGNPGQSGYGGINNDLPIQVQAFYKFQVSDNISVTPGLIYLINSGQSSNNQDGLVGTLRTTFSF